jgi:hypothetical protein
MAADSELGSLRSPKFSLPSIAEEVEEEEDPLRARTSCFLLSKVEVVGNHGALLTQPKETLFLEAPIEDILLLLLWICCDSLSLSFV